MNQLVSEGKVAKVNARKYYFLISRSFPSVNSSKKATVIIFSPYLLYRKWRNLTSCELATLTRVVNNLLPTRDCINIGW